MEYAGINMDKYDALKLENQLCFPLYAASKEIVRKYKPFLEELNLTYTQYITMMVLWDLKECNVKEIGEKLFLDSGTLTPLLKQLEKKGYISRTRNKIDERNLVVSITKEGMELKEKAKVVPQQISQCIDITVEEAYLLHKILYKILETVE